MAAVIRLKRKASEEPAEGLVIELKRTKSDLTDVNEVVFKFAATLNSEKESVKDHVQAVLSREKSEKFAKWRDPKISSINKCTVQKICEKQKSEQKSASDKRKLDYLNNRRLIFTEEIKNCEEKCEDVNVRHSFHLYDIIEESEEIKKQSEETETITCNGIPLVREKVEDYVFDVYVANSQIDNTLVGEAINVRTWTWTTEDIYSDEGEDSEECYEDEDDSNDENNWRNEYPEDESSSGSNHESKNSDAEYDNEDVNHSYEKEEVYEAFHDFTIDDDDEDVEQSFDYSKILRELEEEYEEN